MKKKIISRLGKSYAVFRKILRKSEFFFFLVIRNQKLCRNVIVFDFRDQANARNTYDFNINGFIYVQTDRICVVFKRSRQSRE